MIPHDLLHGCTMTITPRLQENAQDGSADEYVAQLPHVLGWLPLVPELALNLLESRVDPHTEQRPLGARTVLVALAHILGKVDAVAEHGARVDP